MNYKSLFIISFLYGCTYSSFDYKVEPPVYLSKPDKNKGEIGRILQDKKNGFLWDSCKKVNEQAVKSLGGNAKTGNSIADLEWYSDETKSWHKHPVCRKELGWFFTGYFFWWPSATRVKVRGVEVMAKSKDNPPVVDPSLTVAKKMVKSKLSSKEHCEIEMQGDKFDSHMIFSSKDCAKTNFFTGETVFLRYYKAQKKGGISFYSVYIVARTSEAPRFFSGAIALGNEILDTEVTTIDSDVDCGDFGCNWTLHVSLPLTLEQVEKVKSFNGNLEIKLKGTIESYHSEIDAEHHKTFFSYISKLAN